jgi:DNA-binding beta-propeller fold protein YncE
MVAGGVAAALVGAPGARADVIQKGYLYISDYGNSLLDRYQFTYNKTSGAMSFAAAGKTPGSAVFLGSSGSPVKEGVHGTASDIILVGGSPGNGTTTLTRYTLDGQIIGVIPVDFAAKYGTSNVGIGNVLVTPDGRYMYAPLEGVGAIAKIDLTNGAIVNSVAFTAAHDVAIMPNGDVIAANYSAGSNARVILLDSNLTLKKTLISNFSGFAPSGLSITADGKTLYVENNDRQGTGTSDNVRVYDITGTSTLTATFNAAKSTNYTNGSGPLQFTFGNNLGPDGKLYIASLGGGGNAANFAIPAGYVDGIYAFDPVTLAVTRVISGFAETAGPNAADGFGAPKYLQFDTNFVTVPDAGYNLPEPSAMVLLGAGLLGLGALRRRR